MVRSFGDKPLQHSPFMRRPGRLLLVPWIGFWIALWPVSARATQMQLETRIAVLLARIDALERRLAAIEGRAPATAAATEAQPQASSPAAPVANPTVAASGQGAAAEPVTPQDEMARALERALVREGGLLLPPAAAEIEPRFSYLHRAVSGLDLVQTGGDPQLARVSRRADAQQLALGFRVGLPAQMQLDLLLPYASMRERVTAGGLSSADTISGLGASEIGLSWQLWPAAAGTGAVASLRWTEPGDEVFERAAVLPASGSFRAWQASMFVVRRNDPVVFFGALSHADRQARRIAGQRVDPGDVTSLRGGAIIALSPEMSLRLGLDLGWSRDMQVDRMRAPGSGAVTAEFSTGFSFALTPRALLGVEAGIGLTDVSPDFRIGLSLPWRF